MSLNFPAAFGYVVTIQPLKISSLDLAHLTRTPVLAASGTPFIDNDPIVSPSAAVTYTGTGSTFAMNVGGTAYPLDGTAAPVVVQGLSDASPSETESTEEITVYDTVTEGFDLSLGTKKGLSWTFNGYKSFTDAGCKIIELCSLYSVSAGLMVKYCIEGPTGFNEQVYGFARVGAYSEQRPAGTAVKFTCTLNAYGPPRKKFHVPA
jgi:hypothetical protein